jgi:hypothetical protein
MKTSMVCLFLILLVIVMPACKKGDTGPAGPQGPQGLGGYQGPPGNANITIYNYGSRTTTTGNIDYVITNISQGMIDSSLILAYYNPSTEVATAWYQCPGLGSTAAYTTRNMVYQTSVTPSNYTMRVFILNPNGVGTYTSSVTFTKFRIIIAPASVITSLSKGKAVDYSNYDAVRKALNLAD